MKTITKKYAMPFFMAVLLFAGCTTENSAIATEMVVYKASTCPCCDGWIKHMKEEGFKVKTEIRDNDLDQIKAANGITDKLASCHTAKIDGYVIEGHVPAADVKRLLKEKPSDIIGLAAPGMPMKSPGMQTKGLPPKNYNVIAIKKDGSTKIYARY